MSEQNIDPRLLDHARNILAASPTLNDNQRADLWDAYHSAVDSRDLARRIGSFNVPDHIKRALVIAKSITDADNPLLDPSIASVVRVLQKLHQLDPKLLAMAEAHPRILAALISAALKG